MATIEHNLPTTNISPRYVLNILQNLRSEEGVEEGLAGSLGRLGLLLVLLGLDALLLDCGRTSSAPIKLGSLVYTHEAPGDGRS